MQEMTNGGLTDDRLERVREGIRAMEVLEFEKGENKRLLDEARLEIRGLKAEAGAMQVSLARLQTEVENYQRERDYAVGRRAEVEALFSAVLGIMQKYRTETVTEETAPTQA